MRSRAERGEVGGATYRLNVADLSLPLLVLFLRQS